MLCLYSRDNSLEVDAKITSRSNTADEDNNKNINSLGVKKNLKIPDY